MVINELFNQIPSVFDVITRLPRKDNFQREVVRLLEERRAKPSSPYDKDLCSFILGHHRPNSPQLSEGDLIYDVLFALEAGYDGPNTLAILLLFYLVNSPRTYALLTAELDSQFPTGDIAPDQVQDLLRLPYLNAVIHEGLRLGTFLHGLPRVVPERGAIICEKYIPPGTIVGIPAFSQHRSEELFGAQPDVFRPERWLKPDFSAHCQTVAEANPANLMSFSFGSMGCLGRTLAIRQAHCFVAQSLLSFTFSFPSNFDPQAFVGGIREFRTILFRHPLLLHACPRTQ